MSPFINTHGNRTTVFKSGSPEGSANSTFLSRSKITGRMLYFKGKGEPIIELEDTYISLPSPDNNFSGETYLYLEKGQTYTPGDYRSRRVLLKVKKSSYINLYLFDIPSSLHGSNIIDAYEVDPDNFDVNTVTWNNQPSLGNLIQEWEPIWEDDVWWKIPTGTSGAMLLKFKDEYDIGLNQGAWYFFRSTRYGGEFMPYVTDE